MSANTFEARDLNRVAAQHFELRGPVRPRFVSDLLCVPMGADGVYVVGGEPQVLQGRSVRWLMHELVPLLDGTRTVADLETAFPRLDPADVRDALLLLHMHGMVEEADGDLGGQRDDAPPPSEIFFSRYLRRTGRRRSARDAQAALEAARVIIVGDDGLAATLAASLGGLRLGAVQVAATPDRATRDTVDLVVAFGSDAALARASRSCLAARVPLLAVNPDTWTIGPLTVPRASPCWVCASLQLDRGEPAGDIAYAPLRDLWRRALVSRVAQHVVSFATGVVPVLPLEHIEVWRPLERGTALHQFVTRLPSCPACGTAATPRTMTLPSGHAESRARLFHHATMLQPWHLEQPSGMQQHLTPHVLRLQNEILAASPALAPGGDSPRVPAIGAGNAALARRAGAVLSAAACTTPVTTFDERVLGELLFYSFGGRIQGSHGAATVNLHTASAGNLASAEAFVACLRVPGVPPGIYRYVLATNELEAVGSASAAAALADAFCTNRGADETAPPEAVLAIVSSIARVCSKYFGRGYTYALLDAGVMAHRVALVAAELGWSAMSAWRFDDAAAATALDVDGIDLCPHFLIGLGRPVNRGGVSVLRQPEINHRAHRAEQAVIPGDLDDLGDLGGSPIRPWMKLTGDRIVRNIEQDHAGSMLASGGAPFRRVAEMVLAGRVPGFRPDHAPVSTTPPLGPGDIARAWPLPAADDLPSVDRSLASVIVTRRSGGLRPGPLSASELATLLAATTSMPAMVADSTFAPVPYPIVFDVDGIPAGAYRYDGGGHVLAPIREVTRETVAETALLQREHGTGAAILFLVVPLSRWLTRFGDRGYRGAAFSAGWLTDRLYLVAETLGLTYTATGGFAPGVVDELLGIDGCEQTAFFAFAVGGKRRSAAEKIGSLT